MQKILNHRGPDAQGIWIEGNIGLAHTRLSILDLTERGDQPMFSPSGGTIIVYNGEVYNFQELDRQFSLLPKETGTDTETVQRILEGYGAAGLKSFNGMWAFALWDTQRHELMVSVDRVGIKSLYYCFDGNTFAFASETKALVGAGFASHDIDPFALSQVLANNYVMPPYTIYRDIRQLRPGTVAYVDDLGMRSETYWKLPYPSNSLDPDNWQDIGAELCHLLGDSTKKRLTADVPVGVFLSGGVDSSIVSALTVDHMRNGTKSFSIGFTPSSRGDELANATRTSQLVGTEHHESRVTPKIFLQSLDDGLFSLDQPSYAGLEVFFVSRFAREQVKVCLSGTGGDELFAGYDQHPLHIKMQHRLLILQSLPRKHRGYLCDMLKNARVSGFRSGMRLRRLLNYSLRPLDFITDQRIQLPYGISLEDCLALHMKDAFPSNLIVRLKTLLEERMNGNRLDDYLNAALFLDAAFYLPHLLRDTDALSMAHALEVRVPFLDHRVIEFAFTIPRSLKIVNGVRKWILKKSMNHVFGDRYFRGKRGFGFPLGEWISGDSAFRDTFFETLGDEDAKNLFSEQVIRKVLDDSSSIFPWGWKLFCVARWYSVTKRNLELVSLDSMPPLKTGVPARN